MDWRWLILLFLYQIIFIQQVENKEVLAQINTKRLIQYVPERFLSMTIDPGSLFISGKLEQQALNMARGLYPSFVRLGGKATNYLKFGKELFVDNNTITEDQWDGVNKFTQEAGLDLIVSLNPAHRVEGVWDSRDALQLISYSDKHGYNVAWQLGYNTEGQLAPGEEFGRDIVRLRKILDGFQHYARTPLFGPDIPDVQTTKETTFIRDMLVQAGPVLGAIVLQMPFSKSTDPSTMITNTLLNMDSHIWSRELRYGRTIPKKPIWIAEKYASCGSAEDAISLVKHLGIAARTGCQIVLRQVGPQSLKYPTPDFWLALLYKNLVGRGVFESKLTSGNRSDITLFSHCSQSLPKDKSILDTGFYHKGAVTVFGVNESPETVKLSLRASMKDEKAHLFFLTFQNESALSDNIEKTLLNGQLLSLSPSGNLPIISPKIKRTTKYGINVPAKSIFFIVLPDLKTRICTSSSPIVSPDVQSLSKKLIHVAADVLDKPSNLNVRSEEEDTNKVYVKFTKSIAAQSTSPSSDYTSTQGLENSEPDVQVKYITFNDNSWLSKLTETMGKTKVNDENEKNEQNDENQKNENDKYSVLSAAITGTQNDSDLSTTNFESFVKRRKRSTDDKSDTNLDGEIINPNYVVSQEDLVKQLNQYASNIYRNSESGESNKEIQIANIPQEIFNTLKNVKVTFKNLGPENIPKEMTENIGTNDESFSKPIEEEKVVPITLNDLLKSGDESIQPGILDEDKSKLYPILNENKEFDIFNEYTLPNNLRFPKQISGNEQKNLEKSISQEPIDGNVFNTNTLTPQEILESKGIISETSSNLENDPSLETPISDKFQEESGMEQKYPGLETEHSQLSLLGSQINNQETDLIPKSEKTEETSTGNKNFKDLELALPEVPVPADIVSLPNVDSLLDPNTNTMLVYGKTMEPSIITNFGAVANDEQSFGRLTSETEHSQNMENVHKTNADQFSQDQNEDYQSEGIESNKAIHIDDIEQGSQSSENRILQQQFSTKENDQELANEQETPLNIQNNSEHKDESTDLIKYTDLGISEEPKSLPPSLPIPTETHQKVLEDGPPLPSYTSETVKIPREIPFGEEIPENIIQNIPLAIMPINIIQLQEDNKEETKSEIPAENLSIDNIQEENSSNIKPNTIDERSLGIDNKDGHRMNTPEILKEETFSEILSDAGTEKNSGKPFSEPQAESFKNIPLENTKDKSYDKLTESSTNEEENHLNTGDTIPLEIPIEKIDQTYSTADIPGSIPVVSHRLEKETTKGSLQEFPAHSEEFDKTNTQDSGNTEEKNVAQYKLLNKIVPQEPSENKKPDLHKPDIADIDKERKDRLLSLKKQISEIREQFRAQLREEGLKAALQRREEEMRNYLNYEKEHKKKFYAFPLITNDHNVLSRPRRLSYYPESESEDDMDPYDYIDHDYKKRSDSYGMPIIEDYVKPYLQQPNSAPRYIRDHNHILFPLDTKAPQAVVYNDRILPAKLFGIISVNEEPLLKSANVAYKPNVEVPIDSVYQKYYAKHYDPEPVIKEKHLPQISESSLPLETYSLPRDAYIKTMNEQSNYIPIVVLSSPVKNHRKKRSIGEEIDSDRKPLKKEFKKSNLKKRSIEQRLTEGNAFLEKSYNYLNEIPTENHINNLEFIHPNEIIVQKNTGIGTNKFSKRFSEFLPSNNVPIGYIQSGSSLYPNSPPIWNEEKTTYNIEPRHFLPIEHPPLPLIETNQYDTLKEPHEKLSETPQYYFWSIMNDKFKAMLSILQSLADWCATSSSDKEVP